jgi:hypothetical protein
MTQATTIKVARGDVRFGMALPFHAHIREIREQVSQEVVLIKRLDFI